MDLGIKYETKPQFLNDANPEQMEYFANTIGHELVEEVKKRGLVLKYYSINGKGKHFMLNFSGKILLFNIVQGEDHDSEKRFVVMSFMPESHISSLGSDMIDRNAVKRVGEVLDSGTISFLKTAGQILLKSNDSTKIYLQSSSKRRERIYNKYFGKLGKHNIIVMESGDNDLKNKMKE